MPESKSRLRTSAAAALAASWATDTILPEGFLPMLPTTAAGPLDSPDYGYEVKWEGLRALVGLEGPKLAARSTAGQDASFWFPELASVRAAAQPTWVLLDGELVVMDEGRPSPALLQERLQARAPETVAALAKRHPATFLVYDILRIGDSWLLDVTWEERRDILQQAVVISKTVQLSPVWDEGQGALARGASLGLETVVAKRLRGKYSPGEKTRDWLTVKPLEVVDAVICGWTEGRGARAGSIGTLLLGAREGGRWTYVGHTGTGLDAETLRTLYARLSAAPEAACPFTTEPAVPGEPRWVVPEIVCRVRHQGWAEGGKMRSATFLGLTEGRVAAECAVPHGALAVR